MNVLVVDDEPEIVDEVCGFLRRRGFEPIAASGVEAARAVLDGSAAVDVVLTDMRMPPGNGVEVLKACHQRSDPPAMLVMTGQATDEETRQALEIGASSIIPKPLSLRAVLQAMREIEQSRATSGY